MWATKFHTHTIYAWDFQVTFPQVSPPKLSIHFSSLP
jgi:hypothetical protein